MIMSIKEGLVLFYITGLLISLSYSVRNYMMFKYLEIHYKDSLFTKRLTRYLVIKPILWPYFFVTEKSPIERLSECFFKYYGDEGHTYFGSRGLKNFLNDLIKGKNRYQTCQVKTLCWAIDKNSEDWIEFTKICSKDKNLYAHIIYTEISNKFLLSIIWEEGNATRSSASVSRYELDEAEKLSKTEFKNRLQQINKTEAERLNLLL